MAYFNPAKGYEQDPEILAWAKEANLWAAAYLIYDDDERHMLESFENNGFFDADAATIHTDTVALVYHISTDIVRKMVADDYPELAGVLEEAEAFPKRPACNYDDVPDDYLPF